MIVARAQLAAQDVRGREVDEVPVVGKMADRDIVVGNLASAGFALCLLIFLDEGDEGAEAMLVDGRREHLGNFFEGQGEIFFAYRPVDRHGQSDENVAFAVFAFSGFEKSPENFFALGFGRLIELFLPLCYHL